ncbi:DNA-3-methyladenine glycosylase I [Pseudomonadota bacterium]
MNRCEWAGDQAIYIRYHDHEWGVPVHNDKKLFEMLVLEGAQAGLSWITVLKKRSGYRKAFDRFEPEKIARYGPGKVEALMADPGIIRNRLKINAAIQNARAYLDLREGAGTLNEFLWQFTGGEPVVNSWASSGQAPASTPVSEAMSKSLKKRGFRFVGPTICYAFMQAVGIVNDHTTSCFRYTEIIDQY